MIIQPDFQIRFREGLEFKREGEGGNFQTRFTSTSMKKMCDNNFPGQGTNYINQILTVRIQVFMQAYDTASPPPYMN
jgi:hypothetical protein